MPRAEGENSKCLTFLYAEPRAQADSIVIDIDLEEGVMRRICCFWWQVTAGAAFASLLRHCPELSHQIHRAFSLLHLPEMSLILSQMVQDNVESHCIFLQGAGCDALPDTKEMGVVGKRLSQEIADDKEALSGVEQGQKSKRRKTVDSGPGSMDMAERPSTGTGIGLRGATPEVSTAALLVSEGQKHADQAHGLDETMYMNILETIQGAAPDAIPGRYTEEGALTVLRVMAKAFSRLPGTDCWLAALGCLEKWITYGVSKVKQQNFINFRRCYMTSLLYRPSEHSRIVVTSHYLTTVSQLVSTTGWLL